MNTNNILKNDNVWVYVFYIINNMKIDIMSLPFVSRIKMDIYKMLDKEISLLDIKTKFISHWYKNYSNIKNLNKQDKRSSYSNISRC
jgi:hypothetical protein